MTTTRMEIVGLDNVTVVNLTVTVTFITMAEAAKYTAETLAFRAGVPLRTVRFYVQEKLIDPPLSRGRGANFTDHHLAQLQQARALQNAGFTLDTIRERRSELSLGLQVMKTFDGVRRNWSKSAKASQKSENSALEPADCIRIPMAKGVELMVSQDQPMPSPRELVELAFHVRKIFGKR